MRESKQCPICLLTVVWDDGAGAGIVNLHDLVTLRNFRRNDTCGDERCVAASRRLEQIGEPELERLRKERAAGYRPFQSPAFKKRQRELAAAPPATVSEAKQEDSAYQSGDCRSLTDTEIRELLEKGSLGARL